MLDFSAGIVLFSIVCLIVILYKEWLRPSSAFFLTIIVFLVSGVVNTKEALSGFANEQLATIVLLLVIAGVFQKTAVISSAFELVFKPADSEKKFLTKMFAGVGFTSAFLNNTPIVAVLMPYVYDWCKKKNIAPSKMLIPLSYATILGGCITLVGTSSHLIVNGIAEESKATPLQMFDFMLIGIIMLLIGWLYFMLWGYKALPEKKDAITEITSQSRKFFVETHIKKDSPIIGKTVESAGLRKLSGLFLIEILRREKAIKPVSPDEVLEADDVLFFGGHTDSIAELTNPSMGFTLPKACNIPLVEKNTVVEVVISHNSRLVDKKIMDSDFRGKYDGAILAVHRNGEKLEGKLGEINIKAGDVGING
jgi:di/tricarboxylate transporter